MTFSHDRLHDHYPTYHRLWYFKSSTVVSTYFLLAKSQNPMIFQHLSQEFAIVVHYHSIQTGEHLRFKSSQLLLIGWADSALAMTCVLYI